MSDITVVVCLILSMPFNAIYKRIPDEFYRLKCYYIIIISFIFLWATDSSMYGFSTIFADSLFTYVLTKYWKSPYMPYMNFIVLIAHLAYHHILSQIYGMENFSLIAGAQMVLIMKLTSFAWSMYDGTQVKLEKLTKYEREHMVKNHPPFLRFMTYVFYYPTLFTGPNISYSIFDKWFSCEIYSDLPDDRKPDRKILNQRHKKRQIPGSFKPAMIKLTEGIFWMLLYLVFNNTSVNHDYYGSDSFRKNPFFIKIHILYLMTVKFKLKYYAAWQIAHASCIVSGISYAGLDPQSQKINWNGAQNIDIWKIETAQNTRTILESWNISTNKWLKNHIYLRLVPKGKKSSLLSVFVTFFISSFWHGIHPGYYLSFITCALFQVVEKIYRGNFRPVFIFMDTKTPHCVKIFYNVACFWVTQLAFSYAIQPFVILNFNRSFECWAQVYYYVHIILITIIILFLGPTGSSISSFLRKFHKLKPRKIIQTN